MKKTAVIVIFGAAIIFTTIWLTTNNKPSNKSINSNTGLAEQTSSDGAVTIKVTPLNISSSENQWKFKVVLETHSFDLSQDLVSNSLLTDNTGKSNKPLSWEGDLPGGHHRQGQLLFNAIKPLPTVLELKITGIEQDRIFKWDIK